MDGASQPDSATPTGEPASAVDRIAIQRLIMGCSVVIAMMALASWWSAAEPPAVEVPERLLIIDINTASAAELCLLPGIGPVAAEDIVAERTAGGNFASLDDVARRVRGIGPKTIAACRPYVHPSLP